MKIALVHDFLTSYTGAERVLKVLADMFPEAPIYTLLYDEKKVGHVFPANRVKTSYVQKYPAFLKKRRRYLLPKFPTAIESFDLSEYDIVISSSGAWSKGIITKPGTAHICYCHAPMRFAWDWHAEYMREHANSGMKKYASLWLMHRVRMWDYFSSKRPDIWLANSNTTRQRLQKYYHVDSQVIYPPIDIERFSKRNEGNPLGINRKSYYLIVSRLEPYKRIDLAVSAMKSFPDKQLVVIGEGSARETLEKDAGSNITFLGFRDDATITEYYHGMLALFFPGEDDFGITPIEAFACGKPVVAFGKGGATETVIDGQTGILFPDATTQSVVEGIHRLENISWDTEKLISHANRFNTTTFVNQIEQVLKTVISLRRTVNK